jgi:hypothetical protein
MSVATGVYSKLGLRAPINKTISTPTSVAAPNNNKARRQSILGFFSGEKTDNSLEEVKKRFSQLGDELDVPFLIDCVVALFDRVKTPEYESFGFLIDQLLERDYKFSKEFFDLMLAVDIKQSTAYLQNFFDKVAVFEAYDANLYVSRLVVLGGYFGLEHIPRVIENKFKANADFSSQVTRNDYSAFENYRSSYLFDLLRSGDYELLDYVLSTAKSKGINTYINNNYFGSGEEGDGYFCTALSYALRYNKLDCVKLLLDEGANFLTVDEFLGCQPKSIITYLELCIDIIKENPTRLDAFRKSIFGIKQTVLELGNLKAAYEALIEPYCPTTIEDMALCLDAKPDLQDNQALLKDNTVITLLGATVTEEARDFFASLNFLEFTKLHTMLNGDNFEFQADDIGFDSSKCKTFFRLYFNKKFFEELNYKALKICLLKGRVDSLDKYDIFCLKELNHFLGSCNTECNRDLNEKLYANVLNKSSFIGVTKYLQEYERQKNGRGYFDSGDLAAFKLVSRSIVRSIPKERRSAIDSKLVAAPLPAPITDSLELPVEQGGASKGSEQDVALLGKGEGAKGEIQTEIPKKNRKKKKKKKKPSDIQGNQIAVKADNDSLIDSSKISSQDSAAKTDVPYDVDAYLLPKIYGNAPVEFADLDPALKQLLQFIVKKLRLNESIVSKLSVSGSALNKLGASDIDLYCDVVSFNALKIAFDTNKSANEIGVLEGHSIGGNLKMFKAFVRRNSEEMLVLDFTLKGEARSLAMTESQYQTWISHPSNLLRLLKIYRDVYFGDEPDRLKILEHLQPKIERLVLSYGVSSNNKLNLHKNLKSQLLKVMTSCQLTPENREGSYKEFKETVLGFFNAVLTKLNISLLEESFDLILYERLCLDELTEKDLTNESALRCLIQLLGNPNQASKLHHLLNKPTSR